MESSINHPSIPPIIDGNTIAELTSAAPRNLDNIQAELLFVDETYLLHYPEGSKHIYKVQVVEMATPNGTNKPDKALVINSEERIKTSLGSVGGRTHSRPDERINPLGTGRMSSNFDKELRRHK